tara:strand:+ start:609 stop:1148 length:540 start_codon:yes stop_codon:yes gene_type:complete
MGCTHSKINNTRKCKYKRDDLSIEIPKSYDNNYIYTLSNNQRNNEPKIYLYKNDIVKKKFPNTKIGAKRFENEVAVHKWLENESFIQPIFDIDVSNLSFAIMYTKKPKLTLNYLNKSHEIFNKLFNKYGIVCNKILKTTHIRCNGSLIYIVGLSKIPILHKIDDTWEIVTNSFFKNNIL